jgi:hypothetical protein
MANQAKDWIGYFSALGTNLSTSHFPGAAIDLQKKFRVPLRG